MGAAPPRPRRAGSAIAARGRARVVCGGRSPPRPHPGGARAACGSGPPAVGVSFCGGCAPTPPKGWQRNRGAEGGRVSSVGAAPPRPHPGGARAARGSGPPASEFRSVGAAPPRPRRVGSAIAAPRPSACRLWGRRPHAPMPEEHALRAALARPPSEFRSVGAAPPRPRRVGSAIAAPRPSRVLSVGGCAPHAPIPGEHALRAALARPPSEFRSVGAASPRPRRVGSATAAPRAGARLCMAAPGTPLDRHRDASSGNAEPRAQVSGARWPSTSLDATRSATATWMLRGVLGTRSRADARGSERASA